MPIASWLGRSWRIVRTIRGENCPIASCTTTRTIVSTMPVSMIIDAATVPRIASAASGPPVSSIGTMPPSSTATVA